MARQEPSADAYESFSMDNDFEGGQWINGEFYYEKRRQKNKMTKEDHLYGVFNEGFEEEGDASRRAKRGGSATAATLKPMSFVSSGTAVPSATIEQEEEEEEEEAEPVERDPFAASGGGRGGLGYRGANEEDEDEDEEEQHRGLGSFASSATKAGAARQAQQAFVSPSAASSSPPTEEEEEEVYRPFGSAYDALPSSFGASGKGRRRRRATAQREASPPKQQPTPRASASMPKVPKADFEKYSKGVGSRLLAMMGWTGGGLETSTGKGIAAPIEVRLRQGRSGISDDDFRWQQQQQRYGFDDEEAEAEEREEEQREPAWRRKGKESEGGATQIKTRMPTKVRKKKMYKTAEEVLMEKERGQRPQKQVIIDMTQAQPRLLTDLSQQRDREDDREAEAVRKGKGTKEGMPAPELGYNMTFLLDLKEIELQGLNNKLRQERTRCERLEQERAALKERVERERAEADRLDSLLNLILKCEEKVTQQQQQQQQQQQPHDVKPEENNTKLSLKTMSKLFDLIRHKYEREYWQYELAYLVIEMAFPLMREKLKDWRPLKEPALPLDIVLTWKKILLKEEEEDAQQHETEQQQRTKGRRGRRGRGTEESGAAVYRQLLMDVILPPIRKALINEWNPREEESSQACIQLIRLWQSLLTPAILHHHLLQQLILPKLAREVEEKWNPKEDALPIHRWILPWLPFFHQQQHQLFSQRLFPTIRQRLSSLLQREWHPSDASAHAMLSPWKEAFGASAMETLLLRCVLPKLTESLRALVINPAGQRRLERFLDVVRWHDLLPQPHFVALMESEFFPKWYHVLQSWLQQSLLLASTSSSSVQQREQEEREKSAALADTYDEITRWYLGWKKLFPEEIVAHPRIRIHFNHALEVMNHYATHLMSESSSEPFQPFPSPYPSSSPSSSSSSSFAPSSSSSLTSIQDKVREELEQEERKAKKGMLLQEPTLKEVIARFAEENEVLFMPKPNARTADGKQVHSFGGVPIVLGKDLMYAPPSEEDGREAEEGSDSKTWTPIGFDELLKRAKLGRRR